MAKEHFRQVAALGVAYGWPQDLTAPPLPMLIRYRSGGVFSIRSTFGEGTIRVTAGGCDFLQWLQWKKLRLRD